MAKVVSLGIHILDILGRHVSRIPDGQHLDVIDEIRLTVAGTAAGTSVDLAKLGADVTAMGAVGTDELGNFVIDTMNRYGIDTSYLRRKGGCADLRDDAADSSERGAPRHPCARRERGTGLRRCRL